MGQWMKGFPIVHSTQLCWDQSLQIPHSPILSLSQSHTHKHTRSETHTLSCVQRHKHTISLSPFSKPRISIFTSRERVRTFQRSFDPEVKRLDPGWQFRNLIRIRRFQQKLLLRASLRVHQPVDGNASLLALFTACLKLIVAEYLVNPNVTPTVFYSKYQRHVERSKIFKRIF